MKNIIILVTTLILLTLAGCAEKSPKNGHKMSSKFQSVSVSKTQLLQKGKSKFYCPSCGMTLPMFYKTNHAAHVNGKTEQFCSIHCLAVTKNESKKVNNLRVVDNSTLKFIDVQDAWYVVGSSKSGTMSKVSKYAFSTKVDADIFAKKFGGKVMRFDDIFDRVKSSLKKDMAIISLKQDMAAKKGSSMFKAICKPVDKSFNDVSSAKIYLTSKKPCGAIKGKKLQAIAIYLTRR